MDPKGTLGIVIKNYNVPPKVISVWPWHYGESALYTMQSMLIVINYLSCLNPTVPFGFSIDY